MQKSGNGKKPRKNQKTRRQEQRRQNNNRSVSPHLSPSPSLSPPPLPPSPKSLKNILPEDMIHIIYDHIRDTISALNFAMTCKTAYSVFKNKRVRYFKKCVLERNNYNDLSIQSFANLNDLDSYITGTLFYSNKESKKLDYYKIEIDDIMYNNLLNKRMMLLNRYPNLIKLQLNITLSSEVMSKINLYCEKVRYLQVCGISSCCNCQSNNTITHLTLDNNSRYYGSYEVDYNKLPKNLTKLVIKRTFNKDHKIPINNLPEDISLIYDDSRNEHSMSKISPTINDELIANAYENHIKIQKYDVYNERLMVNNMLMMHSFIFKQFDFAHLVSLKNLHQYYVFNRFYRCIYDLKQNLIRLKIYPQSKNRSMYHTKYTFYIYLYDIPYDFTALKLHIDNIENQYNDRVTVQVYHALDPKIIDYIQIHNYDGNIYDVSSRMSDFVPIPHHGIYDRDKIHEEMPGYLPDSIMHIKSFTVSVNSHVDDKHKTCCVKFIKVM